MWKSRREEENKKGQKKMKLRKMRTGREIGMEGRQKIKVKKNIREKGKRDTK